jgi:DNA-binding IclR family transcriptional regulator
MRTVKGDPSGSGVKVLDKVLHLLDVVEYSQPVTLQELVELIGLPRTTAYRLLTALETHGFIRRDDGGRYVTGSRYGTSNLLQMAPPVLQGLTQRTGESSQLFVRRGNQRLCLVAIESPAELRTIVPVGALLPLDRGSGGRVLTSAPKSIPAGWLESVGERSAGVASVSAPVVQGDVLVAAVCLSGPIERFGDSPGRKFGKAVVSAARELERMLAASTDGGRNGRSPAGSRRGHQ